MADDLGQKVEEFQTATGKRKDELFYELMDMFRPGWRVIFDHPSQPPHPDGLSGLLK